MLLFVRRREPGEKAVRKRGRGRWCPKRRVRSARVRSLGRVVPAVWVRRGRWREWKRALPVPRGKRMMVGLAKLLCSVLERLYILRIMNFGH